MTPLMPICSSLCPSKCFIFLAAISSAHLTVGLVFKISHYLYSLSRLIHQRYFVKEIPKCVLIEGRLLDFLTGSQVLYHMKIHPDGCCILIQRTVLYKVACWMWLRVSPERLSRNTGNCSDGYQGRPVMVLH